MTKQSIGQHTIEITAISRKEGSYGTGLIIAVAMTSHNHTQNLHNNDSLRLRPSGMLHVG
jgi:hypothetical protein